MKLHHDKHHWTPHHQPERGHRRSTPTFGSSTPEDLIKNLGAIPEDIPRRRPQQRLAALHETTPCSGEIMKPGSGGEGHRQRHRPADQGRLRRLRGSFKKQVQRNHRQAVRLRLDRLGGLRGRSKLKIVTTPNQDNRPLQRPPCPILGNDIWLNTPTTLKYNNRPARLPRRLVWSTSSTGTRSTNASPPQNPK